MLQQIVAFEYRDAVDGVNANVPPNGIDVDDDTRPAEKVLLRLPSDESRSLHESLSRPTLRTPGNATARLPVRS